MLQVRTQCMHVHNYGVIIALYLDPPQEGDGGGAQKASIEVLEHHYKELNSRKIKDSLSSFLPDIPGTYYTRYLPS